MTPIEKLGLALLHRVDPERAHGLSLMALRVGLAPLPGPVPSSRLATHVAGLSLPNPVGLAAGYDKNATAIAPLTRAGFGFVEVGAATPLPQPGNPKPRLFRLIEDRAAVYGRVLASCGPFVDFATVNVSSPNTEKLRDLQGAAALSGLLAGVMETRAALARPIPVFLKIAPDLNPDELAQVAEVALASGVDAVIATNTTLSREGLKSAHAGEAGGLSGAPLFEKSTRILAQLSKLTEGRLPLIGVGGISTAEEAYAKIRAGASAVQLYTALVYGGLSLVADIAHGLDALLARDGHATIAEATATSRSVWL